MPADPPLIAYYRPYSSVKRCPTHRYKGDHEPAVSCPTCWAIWCYSPQHTTPKEHIQIWSKINAKGMKLAVQRAMVMIARS